MGWERPRNICIFPIHALLLVNRMMNQETWSSEAARLILSPSMHFKISSPELEFESTNNEPLQPLHWRINFVPSHWKSNSRLAVHSHHMASKVVKNFTHALFELETRSQPSKTFLLRALGGKYFDAYMAHYHGSSGEEEDRKLWFCKSEQRRTI